MGKRIKFEDSLKKFQKSRSKIEIICNNKVNYFHYYYYNKNNLILMEVMEYYSSYCTTLGVNLLKRKFIQINKYN